MYTHTYLLYVYLYPFKTPVIYSKPMLTPKKKSKMTSFTLRSTYPVLTTNFKSTTSLLKSSCGEGQQLTGTRRSGAGQLPSTGGYAPRTPAAGPLPPLVTGQRDAKPCLGIHGPVCQCCTHKRENTVQSWEKLLKACRWETALSRRVPRTCTERLHVQYF